MARASWSVEFHRDCEAWAESLPQSDKEALLAAMCVVRAKGRRSGGRSSTPSSRVATRNMKELRPSSTGRTETRVLFAFDLERMAILLVGGDKSTNWQLARLVHEEIPIADERFEQHQAALARRRSAAKDEERPARPSRRRKGRP